MIEIELGIALILIMILQIFLAYQIDRLRQRVSKLEQQRENTDGIN